MNENASDMLLDIPDENLPLLADLYKDHQNTIPHVYGFIKTAAKWRKSEIFGNSITIMAPNGDWKEDGTFFIYIQHHCNDLFMFTLDKTCTRLYNALMSTNRIDFSKPVLLFCVYNDFITAVQKFLDQQNIKIAFQAPCIMYGMPVEEAQQFVVECPPDVYLKELEPSNCHQVNAAWPHRYPGSEHYISDIIEQNGGYGLFSKTTNELVSWCLVHCMGHLGLLQTEDEHQRKGYASFVTKKLSLKIAKDHGLWPFGTVMTTNTPSRSMFDKLGFRNLGTSTFIVIMK